MKTLTLVLVLLASVAFAQRPTYLLDSANIGKPKTIGFSGTLVKKRIDASGKMFAYFVNGNTTYRLRVAQKSLFMLLDDKKRTIYVFNNLTIEK